MEPLRDCFDYATLDKLVLGYLLERGLTHTAFAMKSEARTVGGREVGEWQGSLVDLVAKGQLFSRMEAESTWELVKEEALGGDCKGFSLKGFVDSEIDKRLRLATIEREEPTVDSEPRNGPVVERPVQYRLSLFDDNAFVYSVGERFVDLIGVKGGARRQVSLEMLRNEDVPDIKFVASETLIGHTKKRVYFYDYKGAGKLLRVLSLPGDSEIRRVEVEEQLVVVTTANPDRTALFLADGSNFYQFDEQVTVLQRQDSLFVFSKSANAVHRFRLPNMTEPEVFRAEDFETSGFDVSCERNLLALTGVSLPTKKPNVVFFNLTTAQRLFTYKMRVLGEIMLENDELFVFGQNSLFVVDLMAEKVTFNSTFDCAVERVCRLSPGLLLVECRGNQFKKVNLATGTVHNVGKSNQSSVHLFCRRKRVLFEFENLENFHSVDL